MNLLRQDSHVDIRTFRRELSSIDAFSKLESTFLEKFFKYNVSDYFSHYLSNLYEDNLERKAMAELNRFDKPIFASLYDCKNGFTIEEFTQKITSFYEEKSTSINKRELPFAFKLLYTSFSNPAVSNEVKQGELVLLDVKIKAEVQKIEELPEKIIKSLEKYSSEGKTKNEYNEIEEILSNYRSDCFHVFIVYFGDISFNLFKKQNFQTRTIKLMGRIFKLRMHVFYVSKQSLLETFKAINKNPNIEFINDLMIQFYELKREKHRRKKLKAKEKEKEMKFFSESKLVQIEFHEKVKDSLYLFIGVCGVLGFGFAIRKLLY